jgi:hypothetical protein
MVWWFTATRHNLAITPWVRAWVKGSFIDRFFLTAFTIGVPWWFFWFAISLASGNFGILLVLGWLPWLFWLLDAAVDYLHTNGDLDRFMRRTSVALATRAEYVGGHPRLPHGRFVYLLLRGILERPVLTLSLPHPLGEPDDFDIPLLDIKEMSPDRGQGRPSITESVIASLPKDVKESLGSAFAVEDVALKVSYQGLGGRAHTVQLASFFRGTNEIHNWCNYLICAQAQADTGAEPFGPWKTLQPAPRREEVMVDDASWDGSKVRPIRRAFERR